MHSASGARAASKFASSAGIAYSGGKTEFRGYEVLSLSAKVVALYKDGSPVEALKAGEAGVVVLDQTPFYAESGGQVGDRGELVGSAGTFSVADTQKIQPEVFGHHGTLRTGTLKVGDTVEARVDGELRRRTMRNHSVTHLMHKALREVLGPHVQQKGSLVDAEKTRFDFSHDKPLSADEIRQVEARVNAEILRNAATRAQVMPIEDAKKSGAVNAVRREVRRRGAGAGHRRLARILRRHARGAHRRHRRLQALLGGRRRGRYSQGGGDHRQQCAGDDRQPARRVSRGREAGPRPARRRHGREGGGRRSSRKRRHWRRSWRACARSSPWGREPILPHRRRT
jgi:alanyl-tRNA synthetase